jgi:hypothetical protein
MRVWLMRVRVRWWMVVALMSLTLVAAACGGDDAEPAAGDDVPSGAVAAPGAVVSPGTVVTSGVATTSGGNAATFLSGEGDGAASFEASGGLTVIDLGNVGAGPFQVRLRALGSGDAPETLVEQVGGWVGTVGLGLASGSYQLEVVADGVWFADVRELRDEPAIGPGGYEGNRETFGRWEEKSTPIADEARVSGDYIFGEERWSVTPPVSLEGEIGVGFTYRDALPFGVWLVDESGAVVEVVAEGTGGRERAARLDVPAGVYRVVVEADGVWSLVIRPG